MSEHEQQPDAPMAMPDSGPGEITLDQPTRLCKITQKSSRFAIRPDVVVIPWDTLKTLAAQAQLIDAGMIQLQAGNHRVGQLANDGQGRLTGDSVGVETRH